MKNIAIFKVINWIFDISPSAKKQVSLQGAHKGTEAVWIDFFIRVRGGYSLNEIMEVEGG